MTDICAEEYCMKRGDKIVAAARGLIGVPFRLHGRSAAHGLDCIGLATQALEHAQGMTGLERRHRAGGV
jgi:cell wall-associated NlpC family hydrolase